MMVTKISVTPDEAGIEVGMQTSELRFANIPKCQQKFHAINFAVGYLNAKWEDTRLVGRAALSRSSDVSSNMASVPVELLRHIWRPDLYVYKMRSMDVLQVT